MIDEKKLDREEVSLLLQEENDQKIREIFAGHHPADVALFMNDLSLDASKRIFGLLDPKIASEVIVELKDEVRDTILDEMESRRVSEIVDHLASDDAADVLGALSEEDAQKVLDMIPEEDPRQVKSLLAFEEDTAGGIMQTEFASVITDATVQEVITMLRQRRDEASDMHNVFVTDKSHKLKGILPIRRLVIESPDTHIINVMDSDCISVKVDEDQEEVARIFKKYDLISLPVTDNFDKLVGRITIDDVIDVMEEEASEDIFKMAGAGSEDILSMSTIKSAKTRLPWLFASCIGGIIALKIIGAYEHSLGRLVALAAFIPVILGMGGNIGTQSTTIVVRGLAIGIVDVTTLWRIVYKEVRIGLILGVSYGILLALATSFIYPGNMELSLVVGSSMCASMVVAAAVGTLMPIVFFRLGVDPAVATGPFVTTAIDIIGILILFNFAAFFIFSK